MRELTNLIFCHVVGDFVLQDDFIAKTKGDNWYHLIVHCILYVLPFRVIYGFGYRLLALFISHLVIDALKARYHKIGYAYDQFLHYFAAFSLYSPMGFWGIR